MISRARLWESSYEIVLGTRNNGVSDAEEVRRDTYDCRAIIGFNESSMFTDVILTCTC